MMTEQQRMRAVHEHALRLFRATPSSPMIEPPPDWRPDAMRAIGSCIGGIRAEELVTRIRSGFAVHPKQIRDWLTAQQRQGLLKTTRDRWSVYWERA